MIRQLPTVCQALKIGFAALLASSLAIGTAEAQGPKSGKPNDNTPKAGIYLNGPMQWGRLVDVRTTAGPITKPDGSIDSFYLDVVVAENVGLAVTTLVVTDETKSQPREAIVSLSLETDPDSGHQTLRIGGVIKNPPGTTPISEPVTFSKNKKSAFQKSFAIVTSNLGTIKVGGPSSLPPFSEVPRDAAIVLNFDRGVNPSTIGPDTIQIFVGVATGANQLPPAPFQGRFIWKSELAKQVVVQPTVSDIDDGRIAKALADNKTNPKKYPKINPQVLPINALGFPASQSSTTFNIAVFMPSQYNLKYGVNRILLGKDGTALNTSLSLTKFSYNPSNPSAPSNDGIVGVVRTFRAGGSGDPNQGFLTDKTTPAILGTQQISIDQVTGLGNKLVTFTYLNAACDLNVRVGDSLRQGSVRATVTEVFDTTQAPTYTAAVEYVDPTNVAGFNTIEQALLTTTFDSALATKAGCFVLISPTPSSTQVPINNVDPQSTFTVRFSKPMNVAKLNPFENVVLLANQSLTQPGLAGVFDVVVANVIPSPDLKQFKLVPYLPLPHTQGTAETLKMIVVAGTNGVTDLAGNALGFSAFSFAPTFQLLSSAASNTSRNFNLRFDSLFEGPAGGPFTGPQQFLSGQVTQPQAGVASGRPSTHFPRDADKSNPFVSFMAPFTQPLQTPLSALGSRLQTVYRHIDMNLSVNSITDVDLDVENLAWTPFASPFSDFFGKIRIDAAHSKFFPDEVINPNTLLPSFPTSGLSEQSFVNNIFEVADHPEEVLYDGQYAVNPNTAFIVPSGAVMVPWPKFTQTYTWRDSSFGSKKFGGPGGNGVNPDQYFVVLGLGTPPGTPPPPGDPLKPWGVNAVPSVGLPLLVDFRIYPASDPNTKGLNGFQVAIAVSSSSKPNFRVFSTGGLDTAQAPKTVTPDIAPEGTVPSGGYYPPGSTQGPPGTKTPPGGPEVYYARVDFAIKVSRGYTHFYDLTTNVAGQPNVTTPQFNNSNILVVPTVQPPNTSVIPAFRGASTVTPSNAGVVTDARCFDVYGDPYPNANTIPPAPTGLNCGTVSGLFPAAGASVNYASDITQINTKRFLQIRFTFVNDIVNNVSPTISAFGLAYSNP